MGRLNKVVFVWTPTNASWLNRIECQYTEVKKFVLDNSDYLSHVQMYRALKKFLTYRNNRNKKRNINYLKRH